MRNKLKIFHSLSFAMLTIFLILVAIIATVAYVYRDISSVNPLIHYLIQYRIIIMIILVVLAVAFGYGWAMISYTLLEKKAQHSSSLWQLVRRFLSGSERAIVDYLLKNEGESSQSDISRLEGMDRVRAHRSLQKLEERDIIKIVAHGKIRKIHLNDDIYRILKEVTSSER